MHTFFTHSKHQILLLVGEATTNLGTYFPDYDGGGYKISGFGWHQGLNDRVNAPAIAPSRTIGRFGEFYQ